MQCLVDAALKNDNSDAKRIEALAKPVRGHTDWKILPLEELKTCPHVVQLASGATACFIAGAGCNQIVNV